MGAIQNLMSWEPAFEATPFGSVAPNEDCREARTRIAQELHDTVLQGFFAASMQLQAAFDTLPEDSAARPRFHAVMQLLKRVTEQGRRAVEGLRSPDADSPSLGEALAGIPEELGIPSSAAFRVVVQGKERRLRSGLYHEVYRIVREAIANASRHAQAKEIEVEVVNRPGQLRIVVRDSGCGMDAGDLERGRTGHWGLQGMRERADRIGARLCIFSRVDLGTEVELRVPGRLAFEPSGATAH